MSAVSSHAAVIPTRAQSVTVSADTELCGICHLFVRELCKAEGGGDKTNGDNNNVCATPEQLWHLRPNTSKSKPYPEQPDTTSVISSCRAFTDHCHPHAAHAARSYPDAERGCCPSRKLYLARCCRNSQEALFCLQRVLMDARFDFRPLDSLKPVWLPSHGLTKSFVMHKALMPLGSSDSRCRKVPFGTHNVQRNFDVSQHFRDVMVSQTSVSHRLVPRSSRIASPIDLMKIAPICCTRHYASRVLKIASTVGCITLESLLSRLHRTGRS